MTKLDGVQKTKENVVTCMHCGEEITEYNESAIDLVCTDCEAELYLTCDRCGVPELIENLNSVDNGEYNICDDCIDNYIRCEDCGSIFTRWNTVMLGGTHYCDSCAENLGECYHCDGVFSVDDLYYDDEEDVYFCHDCYNSAKNRIHSYNWQPDNLIFSGNNESGLFYGLELEVENKEYTGGNVVEKLYDSSELLYLKHDGSLYDGFEIVSHPCTIDYHINSMDWNKTCEIVKSAGFRSHDTSTCGLHIHASRLGLGSSPAERELVIAKLMLILDRYWTEIVRFSRRKGSSLERWACKPNADITPFDTEESAIDKLCKRSRERYTALNLNNYKTIEFRFFRGTLNPKTIIASLQLVDVLIEKCKTMKLEEFAEMTWQGLFADCPTELKEYLLKRELLDESEEV